MATAVIMPRQGQSVESCILAKWHKQKGDTVKAGELLFSYETDKAAFDEEAKVDGVVLEVFFEEGDDIPVLTNVCVIGNPGENTSDFTPGGASASLAEEAPAASVPAKQPVLSAVSEPAQITSATTYEDPKISPRARNLAERSGIDPRFASASGPDGRIIERDIVALKKSGHILTPAANDAYFASGKSILPEGTGIGGRITIKDIANGTIHSDAGKNPVVEPQYEEVRLSNMRKVIAKAMQHSLSSTAQLTLNSSFDATEVLSFRKSLKENRVRLGLANITLNDIIIFAVSRTVTEHKDLNAHLLEDKLLRFSDANIGIAVDTPRGLMVPTLFSANRKSLQEISVETKQLIAECQKGTINPDFLKGASFTITNLGTLGIESFTPVLNPPQTGILGVCSMVQRAREKNGGHEFYPAMGLSLTFDHRALDGAPAAAFLQALKLNLENFSLLLLK